MRMCPPPHDLLPLPPGPGIKKKKYLLKSIPKRLRRPKQTGPTPDPVLPPQLRDEIETSVTDREFAEATLSTGKATLKQLTEAGIATVKRIKSLPGCPSEGRMLTVEEIDSALKKGGQQTLNLMKKAGIQIGSPTKPPVV